MAEKGPIKEKRGSEWKRMARKDARATEKRREKGVENT